MYTYYKTVSYWAPRPVMMPLWESVQDASGRTHFELSYHRSYYEVGFGARTALRNLSQQP